MSDTDKADMNIGEEITDGEWGKKVIFNKLFGFKFLAQKTAFKYNLNWHSLIFILNVWRIF